MQLFYNPDIKNTDSEIHFSKDESRHIVKVLRKSNGDTLYITDGKGYLYTSELISDHLKNCVAKITDQEYHQDLGYHLHMAVAPTKMNDRFEWFLEKATEIGVSEITPIICDNSERTVVKRDRFERIIQSALKQSLRYHLPKLNDAINLDEFLNNEHSDQLFIAHCEDLSKNPLKSVIQKKGSYTVLIGPEGDFSNSEITTALSKGFKPVSLGNNRLRTETAAIVACHTIALAND